MGIRLGKTPLDDAESMRKKEEELLRVLFSGNEDEVIDLTLNIMNTIRSNRHMPIFRIIEKTLIQQGFIENDG